MKDQDYYDKRRKHVDKWLKKCEKGVCRMCGRKTEQIFNIDLKMASLCASCEKTIVKQSVVDMYM